MITLFKLAYSQSKFGKIPKKFRNKSSTYNPWIRFMFFK